MSEHDCQPRSRRYLTLASPRTQDVAEALELASLVEVCPNLHLLVTSRELLRVRGEVEYAVPPLAEPEAGRHGRGGVRPWTFVGAGAT